MSKDSSTKKYQDNKERLQKKFRESLSKEEKKKGTRWSWLIQKSIRRWETKAGKYRKKHYKMGKNTLL